MGDWSKGRVNGFIDNVVWAALVHWWPTLLAALFFLSGVWTSLPILYKFGFLLPLVAMFCRDMVAHQAREKDSHAPLNAISEPIQDLQIELVEHGEFSSELILECVNHGSPVTLIATLRVDSASEGVHFKRLSYAGRWARPVTLRENGYGVKYASEPSAHLATGGAGRLRLAIVEAPEKPEGNAYMYLYGTDEGATWDLEHSKDSEMPFFILNVEIRAKGKPQVLCRKYKVGPKSKNESLRMWRV